MEQDTLDVLALLSHPLRVKMLCVLGDAPMAMSELQERTGASGTTLNPHITRLTDCGLLLRHKALPGSGRGNHVRYSVDLDLFETHLARLATAAGLGTRVRQRVTNTVQRARDNNTIPADETTDGRVSKKPAKKTTKKKTAKKTTKKKTAKKTAKKTTKKKTAKKTPRAARRPAAKKARKARAKKATKRAAVRGDSRKRAAKKKRTKTKGKVNRKPKTKARR